MIGIQKNLERLDNVDYAAIMRQAHAERAEYLAMLFKGLLADIRQFIILVLG